MALSLRLQIGIGCIASFILCALPFQSWIPVELRGLEIIAVISSAWSVWLLAKNHPLGWWIGLIGVVLYGIVFYQVKLYAEVGLQAFYLFTSVQAIYIWLKGGENQTEKPVGYVPKKILWISLAIAIASVFALQSLLMTLRGAAPFWDALTTIISLVAQLYLMNRYVESWYLWIIVDVIYVPLYASRSLYLTSFLYVIFGLMAIQGLRNFTQIYREQSHLKVAP